MSLINEESDTPSDLDAVTGCDIVDSKEDVMPVNPNLHYITSSSSRNEVQNSSCVGSTDSDMPTVNLEIENADEKVCNVANLISSGPSPSIPSYNGDSCEFKFSDESDSTTTNQHVEPRSPVRKTVDNENWIKTEPTSLFDSSPTVCTETTVIHSNIDGVVSGNEASKHDIAGKPLCNNSPSMESDSKRVKHEPTEVILAEHQSASDKPTVEEKQDSDIMSGTVNTEHTIQEQESNSDWRTNRYKNDEKSCSTKKSLTNIDPDTPSPRRKTNFACRICLKEYVLYSTVKKHLIQKHPKSRDLCAYVQKANKDSENDTQLVWFCPRKCKYLTSEYNALSEHLVKCQSQKPDLRSHHNKDHGRDTSADGLTVRTQQTAQASNLPGPALKHEMQTVDQDLNDIHTCQQCDSVFSTILLLESHMEDCCKEQDMSTNAGEKPFKCSHCNKSFSYSSQFQQHVRIHTGEKPFICGHCNKSFTRSDHLSGHMKVHTGIKPFKCSHCDKSFSRKDDCHVHMRIHTGEKPFECSICSKRFSIRGHLRGHERTHTGEKPYKCSYCDKSFSRGHERNVHMRTHTGEKPLIKYTCSLCDKRFGQIGHLHQHMKTHTGEKPFSCSQCSKSFRSRSNLDVHVRSHTGEKPFDCSYCNKSFSNRSNLYVHVRSHTGEKPFNCTQCDKSFLVSGHLHRHMRTHTGEQPFICGLCNKSFTQKGSLDLHIRTHTGEKPFECNHCSKSFIRSQDLRVHMRIHTGDKPFKCSHCDKSFTQRGSLHAHIRTHTSHETESENNH